MLDERRKWQIGCRLNAMNRIIPKKESELEVISSHLPEIAVYQPLITWTHLLK